MTKCPKLYWVQTGEDEATDTINGEKAILVKKIGSYKPSVNVP